MIHISQEASKQQPLFSARDKIRVEFLVWNKARVYPEDKLLI